MSRWKWHIEADRFTSRDEEQEQWEDLEEEVYREEEKHRIRLESDYQLELFPEEERQ
tara:strand:+ start:1752 stop:1922 length:171 start_codon:yes stop_codon:yes gene_type:complete